MTPEDKHELRLMIREEVESAIAQLTETNSPQYLPTRKAAETLGYKNVQTLYRAVESGLLRIGKEVQDRRNPNSVNANYYFDIPACQKRLQMVPEKRKS
jgi:hypothetical protein